MNIDARAALGTYVAFTLAGRGDPPSPPPSGVDTACSIERGAAPHAPRFLFRPRVALAHVPFAGSQESLAHPARGCARIDAPAHCAPEEVHMTVSSTERLVNLALFLASHRGFATAEEIRAAVEGYPADQDQAAFARMFERDKKELRSAGFAIETDESGSYRLDPAATFASHVELSAEEAATLRVVATALLDDPGFPFADDLRVALAKIATEFGSPTAPAAAAQIAEESPGLQASAVGALERAASARKRAHFEYTNSLGEQKRHTVEPYGIFARDGRWYLVGRDTELDEQRVYAVARMRDLEIDTARPGQPDFKRPMDFDVASFIGLPFQYGKNDFEAVLRFHPAHAWRAPLLAMGSGTLIEEPDGTVEWHVRARSGRRLERWVVENGPGIDIVEPPELAEDLSTRITQVVAMHTGSGNPKEAGDRG